VLGAFDGGVEGGVEDGAGAVLELGGVVGLVLVVVEVSDRLVADRSVPVFGRSHAAMANASSAGNATMRIRFTRFS
jgi:hypothetical protein